MANWSDPRPGATPFATAADRRSDTFDAGLRRYMLSVYNYMFSGILLTGLVAMFFSWGGMNSPAAAIMLGGGLLKYVIMFAPLAFVFGMSFGGARMSAGTLQAMFWGFAVAMGLSLSTIFLVYTQTSIVTVFFVCAATFAATSLWGYTTKTDLSRFGSFLIMGLFGVIIASVVNIFVHSSALQFAVSIIGVLVFTGLTAYDTQRIKADYVQQGYGYSQDVAAKRSVYDALSLYLNFINLFLMLLQIMGNRNSN